MEQVLYSLPDGWKKVCVDDICTKITDGAHKTPKYTDDGVPFLSVKDVNKGLIDFSNTRFVSQETHDDLYKRCNPERNDILYTKVGSTGVAKVVDTDREFSLFVSVALLKPKSVLIDSKYFEYALNSPESYTQAQSLTRGVANRNLVLKDIKSITFNLAPIKEQKRIVEKLDALLSRIDTAIEHLQESVTLADALYASELNEVFPSDADIESLSDKAGWVSLSDICTFENGDRGKNYPSKSAFVAEGIPVVSAGNLGERYIDHKGLNYITPERYDLLRSGRIKIGDILFCLRGSLGKVAISKDIDEGVIASSLVIIRPKACVSAEYIYKYLKSSLCQQFISFYNNGAAQPNLSAKSLGKFMLPLPNADEQKIIIDGLDEKYQLNQKLLDALRGKIDSLKILKASILDSAFKGEL